MFDMQMEVPWNWFPSLMTHFSGVPPTHTLLSLRTEKIPLRAQAFGVMFGGRTEPTAHSCQLSSELCYTQNKQIILKPYLRMDIVLVWPQPWPVRCI